MKTRGYEGIQDLYAMLDLLSEGGQVNAGTHYVHRGDLQWWLFYNDAPENAWHSNVRLWHEDDRLIGWALISPEENAFDVFTAPELRGDAREREMLEWATNQMDDLDFMETVWVAETDDVRTAWLEAHGFQRRDRHFVNLVRSISDPLDAPALPAGFQFRTSRGPEDAQLRSAASHGAFGSTRPFEEYWPRTLRFMQSPIYVPEHELFVVAPNGEVASYCIFWTDPLNKLGHFEPVGTHPNYQRLGLGKSLMLEAMRRLKSEGMTSVDLCTNDGNDAAIGLYESVGMRIKQRLRTYWKAKSNTS